LATVNDNVFATAPFHTPVTIGGGATIAVVDTDPTALVAVITTVHI
jgi:hypothetical protein